MDSTIIAALIGAAGSIIVALIASRGRPTGFQMPAEVKADVHGIPSAHVRRPNFFARVILWILYFITVFFLFGTVGAMMGDEPISGSTAFGMAFIDVVLVGSSLLFRRWLLSPRQ
jgi:hypothetical protein